MTTENINQLKEDIKSFTIDKQLPVKMSGSLRQRRAKLGKISRSHLLSLLRQDNITTYFESNNIWIDSYRERKNKLNKNKKNIQLIITHLFSTIALFGLILLIIGTFF